MIVAIFDAGNANVRRFEEWIFAVGVVLCIEFCGDHAGGSGVGWLFRGIRTNESVGLFRISGDTNDCGQCFHFGILLEVTGGSNPGGWVRRGPRA